MPIVGLKEDNNQCHFYLVTEMWKDKHVMCSKVQPTNTE